MKKPINPDKVLFIVVDSFCGAGGFTEGCEKALDEDGNRISVVIAGINHDAKAIASHERNHPETVHFVEDVRDATLPTRLTLVVSAARSQYPNALLVFHASLECTNFSNAKGGMERDPDSRSLADFMPMYLDALQPDLFTVENVREFMGWGPMKPKIGISKDGYEHCFIVPVKEGKGRRKKIVSYKPHWVPIKERKGEFFEAWKEKITKSGYTYGHKLDNTANFGANTSRTRYFGIFAQDPDMRVWPEQTHAKDPSKTISGKKLEKWRPIRECLNLDVKGNTIFRDPPLKPATYERILEGLLRNVGNDGDREFISKYFSGSGMNFGLDEPAHTLTAIDHHSLIQCENFVMSYYSGSDEHRVKSLDEPSGTLTTCNRIALVNTEPFCVKYHGKGGDFGIESPCSTVTVKDRISLIQSQFIDLQFSQGKRNQSVEDPASALTTIPKHKLISVQFIDKQYGMSKPSSLEDPAACITVNPHLALVQAFIYDPSWFGHSHGIDSPAPTITASQHKSPLGLVNVQFALSEEEKVERTDSRHFAYVTTEDNLVLPVIIVQPDDCDAMKKIKIFMAMYGISDILMRMLMVIELLRIQGFPPDYVLLGSDSDKKKFIGNSIPPKYVKCWFEALGKNLKQLLLQAA